MPRVLRREIKGRREIFSSRSGVWLSVTAAACMGKATGGMREAATK